MLNAGELNSKLATKSEFQSLNARYLTKGAAGGRDGNGLRIVNNGPIVLSLLPCVFENPLRLRLWLLVFYSTKDFVSDKGNTF